MSTEAISSIVKIKIEKHKYKYVAYPVGLEGIVVAEGATREEAVTKVKSAIRSYMEKYLEQPQTEYPTHILSVMGVVRNSEGEVLLIRSPRRGWEPPGGQVENGEDIVTALKREVLEESGIVIEIGRLIAVYSNIASDPTKLNLIFEANIVGGSLQTSEESLNVGWFSPEEAIEKVINPAQRQKLQDGLLNSRGVIYRVYGTNPYKLLQTTVF